MIPDCPLRVRFELRVSAASGLVVRDGIASIVADDGLRLHRHALDGTHLPDVPPAAPGTVDAPIPKPLKPDLEALVDLPDGRLLAFGSGSRPNRERALLFDPRDGTVRPLDLGPLYARIRAEVDELNVEGAALVGDRLVLANRGAGHHRPSALVLVDARACGLAEGAVGDPAFPAAALEAVRPLDLPELDGVALHLTDLAVHPSGGLHFLAAAEATDDAYADGAVRGSVLGRFGAALQPLVLARLRPDVKAEGLAWWKADGATDVWLVVCDADDPARLSPLYEARLPRRDP